MYGQEATIPRPITTGTGARGTLRASVRLSTETTARLDALRLPGESRAAAVARIIHDAAQDEGGNRDPDLVTSDDWYTIMATADPVPPKGTAFACIQWKGTVACLDVVCTCGHSVHLDVEFAYAFRCPACRRLFALSPVVRMVELPESCADELVYATHPNESAS